MVENIKNWIFDLDNTLYPSHADLFSQVDYRMGKYIVDMFDVSYVEAKKRQKKLFTKHGTTLRGLMTEHGIEPQEYLNFVHDIDFSVLSINQKLNDAIRKLPGKKFIFTNASTEYAKKVLSHIGLTNHFDGFFDIHDGEFIPKPNILSYNKMLDKFSIDPNQSIMFEDMAVNLNPASELGMTTVWIPTGSRWAKIGQKEENIDHVAPDLAEWLSIALEQLK